VVGPHPQLHHHQQQQHQQSLAFYYGVLALPRLLQQQAPNPLRSHPLLQQAQL
jgi:hypothetical protein